MSITITENFKKSSKDLISCQMPLVFEAESSTGSTKRGQGDMWVNITGQSPTGDTTTYTFEMVYKYSIDPSGSGLAWINKYRLNVTDIIRKIVNELSLESELSGDYYNPSRLACPIEIEVDGTAEGALTLTNYYMHGFNEIGDASGACLEDLYDAATAMIPIAPGVAVPFYLYVNTAESGNHWSWQVLTGTIYRVNMGMFVSKGLYELHYATVSERIYDAFDSIRPQEYLLTIDEYYTDWTSRYSAYLVAIAGACADSTVLAWSNRYGTYSSIALERYNTKTLNQNHIGTYSQDVVDPADVRSQELSRGYKEVYEEVTAVLRNVPIEYMEYVQDLFYSADVYLYTGSIPNHSFDESEWLRVIIDGTWSVNTKKKFANLQVRIKKPKKYTQLR